MISFKRQTFRYSIIGIAVTILILIIALINLSQQLPAAYNHLSFDDKIQKAKSHYEYYTGEVTKEELLIMFIEMFSDFDYQLNGDSKWKDVDCSQASWRLLKRFGYPGKMKSTRHFLKAFENLGIKKRVNKPNIRHTDIIIMDINRITPHMGIVWKVTPSVIQYIDVNSYTQGMALPGIKFSNSRIYGIYPMKYKFWIEDLLNDK